MWKLLSRAGRIPLELPGLPRIIEDGPIDPNDDRCHCGCHKNPAILHCKPCCRFCASCRQMISDGKYEDHVKRCLLTGGRNP
jgi:hypothetical protein